MAYQDWRQQAQPGRAQGPPPGAGGPGHFGDPATGYRPGAGPPGPEAAPGYGGGFDPLAAPGDVPSWPVDPLPEGPPRLAPTGPEGMAGAWPELPGLPEIGASVRAPKLGVRILIPIAATMLIGFGLMVPWSSAGESLWTVVGLFADRGVRDFGGVYALYFAVPVALLCVLVAFAGATDLKPVRLLVLAVSVLVLGGVALFGLAAPSGLRTSLLLLVGVLLLASVVVGLTRRLAVRLCAGGYLLGCAVLHVGTLATWQASWLSPLAYLLTLGYLLGAAGAVIGPEYVSKIRQI